MTKPDSYTTTLQDIRALLGAHGQAPAPWSSPDEVVQRLSETLRARAGDDGLWRDLGLLAARIEARQTGPRTRPDRDVLAGPATESLLEDLRAALRRGDADDRSLGRRVLEALGGPGLAALLLLGAAGCGGDDLPESCDPGALEGDEAAVYCDLWTLVDEAAVTDHRKSEMFRCLDDRDALDRADLLDQFSDLTDEQLAAALGERTDDCEMCDYDASDDQCDAH